MNDSMETTNEKNEQDARDKMVHDIGGQHARKMRARRNKDHSAWFGLGMIGTIGWTVAIPTLLGVALGLWIDAQWPGPFSWTLTLLFTGLVIGCINAWMWISREQESMEREKEERKIDRDE